MNKNLFLKLRYGLLPYFDWKPSLFLAQIRLGGIAPVYSRESIKKQLIFIHIPKAAGSSVGLALLGTDKIGHYPAFIYRSWNEKRFKNFHKVSVVREPLERVHSAYEFLLNGGKGEWDYACGEEIKSKSSSFQDFVDIVMTEEFIWKWVHFVPQYYFLECPVSGEILVDDILRLDELDQKIQPLIDKYSNQGKLTKENKTIGKSKIVELDFAGLEKIKKLYSRDYELFLRDRCDF